MSGFIGWLMHVQRQRQVAGSLELKTAWSTEFQDSRTARATLRNPGAGTVGEGEEKPLGFMSF